MLLALLVLGGPLAAARPPDRLPATRPGPLYATPDGGEGELLAFDARVAPALASLAVGERIAVDAWPVAPGLARTMVLTRTEVYAPDARIVAIGSKGEVEVARSGWIFLLGRDPSGSARTAVALDPDDGRAARAGGLRARPPRAAPARRVDGRPPQARGSRNARPGRDAAQLGMR